MTRCRGPSMDHVGTVFAVSVSVCPYKPSLVNSVGRVLLVSSTPLALTILFSPSMEFHECLEKGPSEDLEFGALSASKI